MKRNVWKSTLAVAACMAALVTVGSAAESAAAGVQMSREHTWCC